MSVNPTGVTAVSQDSHVNPETPIAGGPQAPLPRQQGQPSQTGQGRGRSNMQHPAPQSNPRPFVPGQPYVHSQNQNVPMRVRSTPPEQPEPHQPIHMPAHSNTRPTQQFRPGGTGQSFQASAAPFQPTQPYYPPMQAPMQAQMRPPAMPYNSPVYMFPNQQMPPGTMMQGSVPPAHLPQGAPMGMVSMAGMPYPQKQIYPGHMIMPPPAPVEKKRLAIIDPNTGQAINAVPVNASSPPASTLRTSPQLQPQANVSPMAAMTGMGKASQALLITSPDDGQPVTGPGLSAILSPVPANTSRSLALPIQPPGGAVVSSSEQLEESAADDSLLSEAGRGMDLEMSGGDAMPDDSALSASQAQTTQQPTDTLQPAASKSRPTSRAASPAASPRQEPEVPPAQVGLIPLLPQPKSQAELQAQRQREKERERTHAREPETETARPHASREPVAAAAAAKQVPVEVAEPEAAVETEVVATDKVLEEGEIVDDTVRSRSASVSGESDGDDRASRVRKLPSLAELGIGPGKKRRYPRDFMFLAREVFVEKPEAFPDLPDVFLGNAPVSDRFRDSSPRGSPSSREMRRRDGGDRRQFDRREGGGSGSGSGRMGMGTALSNRPKQSGGGESRRFGPPRLEMSSKGYRIRKDVGEVEALKKKVNGILNKLTLDKFETLASQLLALIIEQIHDADLLKEIVKIIFDKALGEAFFAQMYAQLCFTINAANLPEFVEDEKIEQVLVDEDGHEVDPKNPPPNCHTEDRTKTVTTTFKRILLNKCQEEFEQGTAEVETAGRTPEEVAGLQRKQKTRMLGNIRFIGELYKRKMINERIMHECINHLMRDMTNPLEEDIEALCKLMSTIGSSIDISKSKSNLDNYFQRLKVLSVNKNAPSRIRFMCLDLIDLRSRNWIDRQKKSEAKTIAEIHKDVAREQALKGGAVPFGRPAGGGGGGRGGGGGGGGGRGTGNFGGTPSSSPLASTLTGKVSGDVRASGGPSPSAMQLKGRTDRYAKLAAGRGSSAAAPSPSPTARDHRDSRDSRGDARAGQSAWGPRRPTSDEPDERNGTRKPSPSITPAASPAASAFSRADLEPKIDSLIKEFVSSHDFNEAKICIEELKSSGDHYLIVSRAILLGIEMKEADRPLVVRLLVDLAKANLLGLSDFGRGIEAVLQALPDVETDLPLAPKFVAKFTSQLISAGFLSFEFLNTGMTSLVEAELSEKFLGALLQLFETDSNRPFVEKLFHDSHVNLLPLMSEQSPSALGNFVTKHNLQWLLPLAEYEGELTKLLQSDAPVAVVVDYVQHQVPAKLQHSDVFSRALLGLVFSNATTRTTCKKGRASPPPTAELVEEERKLLTRYNEVLQQYKPDAADAIDEAVNFYAQLNYAPGLLSRLFIFLSKTKLVPNELFIRWRDSQPSSRDAELKSRALRNEDMLRFFRQLA